MEEEERRPKRIRTLSRAGIEAKESAKLLNNVATGSSSSSSSSSSSEKDEHNNDLIEIFTNAINIAFEIATGMASEMATDEKSTSPVEEDTESIQIKVSTEFLSKRAGDAFHDFLESRTTLQKDDKPKLISLILYFNFIVNLTSNNMLNEILKEDVILIYTNVVKKGTFIGNPLAHEVMTTINNNMTSIITASRILHDKKYKHIEGYILLLLKLELENVTTGQLLFNEIKSIMNELNSDTNINLSTNISKNAFKEIIIKYPNFNNFIFSLKYHYEEYEIETTLLLLFQYKLENGAVKQGTTDFYHNLFTNDNETPQISIQTLENKLKKYIETHRHMHINHDFPNVFRTPIITSKDTVSEGITYEKLNVKELGDFIHSSELDDNDEYIINSLNTITKVALKKLFLENKDGVIFEGDAHTKSAGGLLELFNKENNVYLLNTPAGKLDAAPEHMSKQTVFGLYQSNKNHTFADELVQLEEQETTTINFNTIDNNIIQETIINQQKLKDTEVPTTIQDSDPEWTVQLNWINQLISSIKNNMVTTTENNMDMDTDKDTDKDDFAEEKSFCANLGYNGAYNEAAAYPLFKKIIGAIREWLEIIHNEDNKDAYHDMYYTKQSKGHCERCKKEHTITDQQHIDDPTIFWCETCENYHIKLNENEKYTKLKEKARENDMDINMINVKFNHIDKMILTLYNIPNTLQLLITFLNNISNINVAFSFPNNPIITKTMTNIPFSNLSVTATSSHLTSDNITKLYTSIFETTLKPPSQKKAKKRVVNSSPAETTGTENQNLVTTTMTDGMQFFLPLLAKGSGDINPFVTLADNRISNLNEKADIWYDTGDQNAYLLLLLLTGENKDKFKNVFMTTSYTIDGNPIFMGVRIGDNEDIFKPTNDGTKRSYGTYQDIYNNKMDHELGTIIKDMGEPSLPLPLPPVELNESSSGELNELSSPGELNEPSSSGELNEPSSPVGTPIGTSSLVGTPTGTSSFVGTLTETVPQTPSPKKSIPASQISSEPRPIKTKPSIPGGSKWGIKRKNRTLKKNKE